MPSSCDTLAWQSFLVWHSCGFMTFKTWPHDKQWVLQSFPNRYIRTQLHVKTLSICKLLKYTFFWVRMLIKCFAVCMLTLIHQTAWINQETQQWLACAAPGTAGTRAMNHVFWSGLWKELCVCVCFSDRQREQSGGTKSYSSSLPMHLPSKTHSGFMGYQCYWSLIWIHCLSIFTLTCDVTMFNPNCRLLRMWSFWSEAMGRGQWKWIVGLQWFVWFSFCHCPQKRKC